MKTKEESSSSSSSSPSPSISSNKIEDSITNGICLKTRSGRTVKYNTDYTERYVKKK